VTASWPPPEAASASSRASAPACSRFTAPNATDTSSEGIYDTSTIDKDVTAVVSLTFAMR